MVLSFDGFAFAFLKILSGQFFGNSFVNTALETRQHET